MIVSTWIMALGFFFCGIVSICAALRMRQIIMFTIGIPALYTAFIYALSNLFVVGDNFLMAFARPGTLLTVLMVGISLIYMLTHIQRRS